MRGGGRVGVRLSGSRPLGSRPKAERIALVGGNAPPPPPARSPGEGREGREPASDASLVHKLQVNTYSHCWPSWVAEGAGPGRRGVGVA